MANNFDSNVTEVVNRIFLEKFENARVLSKQVDTQMLTGKFNPSTGDTTFFKRPTDYKTIRTSSGDITSETPSDIVTGKAAGIVQDYFTEIVDYDEADEAIKMDQIDKLLEPLATRMVTDIELDFGEFMLKNTALLAGTVGNAVTTWAQVAEANAIMKSHGIPGNMKWTYAVNPFTQVALAETQKNLGAGGVAGTLIDTAHAKAMIHPNFAGMEVLTTTSLASFTTAPDRAGVVNGGVDETYNAAKDTMTQVITVDGLTNGDVYKAGEIMQIADVNRLNLSTRKLILDENGVPLPWTATLVQDTAMVAGNEAVFTVTGPAIFEVAAGTGAFNTASSAIADNAVVTFLGGSGVTLQPNLFWHKQAFSIGSVPIKSLHSTDTFADTEDGFTFRVSKGSDFLANRQQIRIDFRPAYAVLNPFFAGQGWG